jgi:hypothetical protein
MKHQQPIRIENPTREQLDRCIAEHRPAIFSGVMQDSVAAQSWDLPYLRSKLAGRTVQVVQHDKPRLYWDPNAGLPHRPFTFDEFADSAFVRKDGGFQYLQDDVNSFPLIRDDYKLPPMMADKGIVRGKFWMSGNGLITPLHYDAVETLHWVIRGSKRFLCYGPGVRRYYPFSVTTTAPFISQVDPDHPDPARFPRFHQADPVDFEVHAGEILYLPAFWWHQVYSQAALNISLNFVWWASLAKSARHLPQLARAGRHLAIQLRKVRAKEKAAEKLKQASP